jgi:hypothetical protein
VKYAVTLVLYFCAVLFVHAQSIAPFSFNPQAFPVQKSSGASAGYQGPADIASGAITFWSCGRAAGSSYAASQGALCGLVDTATGLLSCTVNAGTNGFVNLTATVCPTSAPTMNVVNWCTTVGGCSVAKFVNQINPGTYDEVQATLANMAGLTLSAQNSLPCGAGQASVKYATAATITQAAPYSLVFVGERTGSFTTGQLVMAQTASVGSLRFTNVANTMGADANGTLATLTAADSAFHAAVAVFSASNPLFAVDSSANTTTTATGTTGLSSTYGFMSLAAGTSPLIAGFACEGGIWNADLNSTYVSILANETTVWGPL